MRKLSYIALLLPLLLNSASGQGILQSMTAFNAGEVSPLMEARTDFPRYDNSARILLNMLVLTQGPVARRPGTKFIAEVKDSSVKARIIPFEFSKDDTYILEFGNLYMRVYRDSGVVLDGADPFELVTEFLTADLFDIQFAQADNTMYLVHGDHLPQILTRTDHNDWSIADANFTTGPFVNENVTDTQIRTSGTTGSITVIADTNLWTTDHIGALWRITHRTESTALNGTLDANESSATIAISGGYDFTTHGTWTGTVRLERSFDAGSIWEAVTTRHSEDDTNIDFPEIEETSGVIYRVVMEDYVSGTATYNLSIFDSSQNGIVRITAFTDANEVTATVISDLADTVNTTRWAEGYWSNANGFPQTIVFHQERVVYAGSESFPQTVWVSESGNLYENMTDGLDDDDAFAFALQGQNPVQWMVSQDFILVGTINGAGKIGRTNEDLTPRTAEFRMQVPNGSAYIQATLAGDAVLYVERGGFKIREFVFSFERDSFVAPDLTVLSEHITKSGIIETSYQARPESILWSVRNDGVLLSLTYENRDQGVVGWARHITNGEFESVATIAGSNEDEVWVIVKRTIDDSTVRYVEQFQSRKWDDQADAWYLDSGLAFDGGDAVDISYITKGSPSVVRVAAWPTDGDGDNLADGDQILITGVEGMDDVNGMIYTIDDASVSALSFTLNDSTDAVDVDSTGFSTYLTGGTVQRYEKDFTGLGHLEGESVIIYSDGAVQPAVTVSNGAVSIDEWANNVKIGMSYTSVFESMPVFFDTQGGSSSPEKKIVMTVYIDFLDTLGAKYGVENNVELIDFSGESTDIPQPVFSGFKSMGFPHGIWDKATIRIEEDLAIPMTIRAVYIRFRW